MCLAVPGLITALDGATAQVDVRGVIVTVNVSLIDDPGIGDYVMVHTGFAIQKYDEAEAIENLRLIEEAARRADGIR
jgi:hydrogenase expression/formation protein HypC